MINLYVCGRSLGAEGAGFTVRLCNVVKDVIVNDWIRTFMCNGYTSNQAELKGVEYVLRSISDSYIDDDITIIVGSRYSATMLERVGEHWTKNPASNIELVGIVRDLYLKYPSIRIYCDIEDDTIKKIAEINNVAVKKGTEIFDQK